MKKHIHRLGGGKFGIKWYNMRLAPEAVSGGLRVGGGGSDVCRLIGPLLPAVLATAPLIRAGATLCATQPCVAPSPPQMS